jgi:ubiquinone/menaquinone biosynthesis C-methylase UbiE
MEVLAASVSDGRGGRGARPILNDSMRVNDRVRLTQDLPLSTTSQPPQAEPQQPRNTDGGYAADTRSAWTEFLAILPADARILDIGINNHVPALIAADLAVSQDRAWRIDAIDPAAAAAQRNAHDQARIARITFHQDGGPDRLPFEDNSFDAACGHHTLEFTDTATALAEIHRLLKQGADAQFLLHHAESPAVASARLSLQEADLVFGQTKAFRRVHRLVTMSQVVPGTTERATDDVRAAIRTLKQALETARMQGGGRILGVALDAIQQLLAARREHRPDATGLAVDRAEAELRTSVRRLAELVVHARDDAGMQQIEANAAAAGFTQIERAAHFSRDGQPMAWQLLLHRP